MVWKPESGASVGDEGCSPFGYGPSHSSFAEVVEESCMCNIIEGSDNIAQHDCDDLSILPGGVDGFHEGMYGVFGRGSPSAAQAASG